MLIALSLYQMIYPGFFEWNSTPCEISSYQACLVPRMEKINICKTWTLFFQVLANMCKQGFDDALMFLHRNNLISCTRCLAVQSTYVISDTLDESLEFDPECQECKMQRQVSAVELSSLNESYFLYCYAEFDSHFSFKVVQNPGPVHWVPLNAGLSHLIS